MESNEAPIEPYFGSLAERVYSTSLDGSETLVSTVYKNYDSKQSEPKHFGNTFSELEDIVSDAAVFFSSASDRKVSGLGLTLDGNGVQLNSKGDLIIFSIDEFRLQEG